MDDSALLTSPRVKVQEHQLVIEQRHHYLVHSSSPDDGLGPQVSLGKHIIVQIMLLLGKLGLIGLQILIIDSWREGYRLSLRSIGGQL